MRTESAQWSGRNRLTECIKELRGAVYSQIWNVYMFLFALIIYAPKHEGNDTIEVER
jgi:hypothetical protein